MRELGISVSAAFGAPYRWVPIMASAEAKAIVDRVHEERRWRVHAVGEQVDVRITFPGLPQICRSRSIKKRFIRQARLRAQRDAS